MTPCIICSEPASERVCQRCRPHMPALGRQRELLYAEPPGTMGQALRAAVLERRLAAEKLQRPSDRARRNAKTAPMPKGRRND